MKSRSLYLVVPLLAVAACGGDDAPANPDAAAADARVIDGPPPIDAPTWTP